MKRHRLPAPVEAPAPRPAYPARTTALSPRASRRTRGTTLTQPPSAEKQMYLSVPASPSASNALIGRKAATIGPPSTNITIRLTAPERCGGEASTLGRQPARDMLSCHPAVASAGLPRRLTRTDQAATRPDRTRTLLDAARMSRYGFLMGLTPVGRCFTLEMSLGSPCSIRRSLFRTIAFFAPSVDARPQSTFSAHNTAAARSISGVTHSGRRTPP